MGTPQLNDILIKNQYIMNFKKVILQDQFSTYLQTQPRQGKDIQIVDIYFKDGNILKERVVSYHVYLQANIGEKINIDDIIELRISPPVKIKMVESEEED